MEFRIADSFTGSLARMTGQGQHADRLLPATVSDVAGNAVGRRGTVSMFDGPPPMVMACTDADHDCRVVGNWINARPKEGYAPNEVGVSFGRTQN